MTEETRSKLLNNTELKIVETSKSIDEIRKLIIVTDDIQLFSAQNKIEVDLINMKKLAEYRMFIGLVLLDLASATRIHLNAKLKYESLFSARQIIVIINEAYKKMYNFINMNEKGGIIAKNRNNSFWIKNIGVIVKKDLPNLQNEYNIITQDLDNYLKINFDFIKEQRDLSVHYDKDAVKVYDMLIKIDIEETFKKLIGFIDILNKMFDFTNSLVFGYMKKTQTERIKNNLKLENYILNLDKYKNPDNREIISDIQDKLRSFEKILNPKKRPNT